jgi:lipoprotein NlpI
VVLSSFIEARMKCRDRTHLVVIFLTVAGACKAAAPDAGALTDSGIAAMKRGDTTAAVQRFDSAIALKPDLARAYRLRGDARKGKGEYDAAIADYDQAIKLKGDDAGTFSDRAFAHQGKGEYDLAIQDFDRALALKPDHALALKNRGRTQFYLGHFAEAAADLRRGAVLDSTNAYVAIWLHMAVKRLGQDNMPEFAAQLARTDSTKWPTPVARLYQGRLTPEQLMATAANTDSKAQADQRCAASFYIGEAAMWNKQSAEATKRFQETVASCPKSFTEYDAAHAELGRLAK